jgi:inosine-uridine nucleoside N-ribohydrolase
MPTVSVVFFPLSTHRSINVKRLTIIACLILCVSTQATFAAEETGESRPRLILDTDSANEIDDMYAIVRMLNQDKFEVLGLNSTQWLHYLGDPKSVQASQQVNEDLLQLVGRTDLKSHLGAEQPMGKPWGGDDPEDSPAAQFIIKQAKALPDDEQLHVVCLGATTNLATALKLAPEIVPRVRAYLMGFRYDAANGVWNKSEFNVRRDLNAADYLLDCEGLELHIMSATVSRVFTYDRDDTFRRHRTMGALGEYLTGKWKARFANNATWVMWDLALVEALIRPELAHEIQVDTPPENTRRKVWVYDSIKAAAMRDDYWKVVQGRQT